ncbi:hypothetical protein BCR32DRAFT_300462 [Anaeromyces robustus]|uniref:G-protein coupled receptors family 3 profile domain-containing protein n=1 Tax=Anaeromyces robustus TaxID=1754192 RepID=A0A1Y1X2Z7_9FUNG|nr:hypothetical protein BCR32DRAFT_300462 [Anaeromyces robustus]|eukprot:ORX80035.1 hypothetical protein BCR32DRAFT_300462 [Anaeromyces robustus]
MSVSPGRKEGINGSVLGGYNLGINKYIDDERRKAALTVLEYFISVEFQKEVIVKQLHLYTALSKLYDDPDNCKNMNCNIMKEAQFFLRPGSTMRDYEYFSKKAIKYFYDFMDGEKSSYETLRDIEDIIHVYSLTLSSSIGLIVAIILFIMLGIVIISTFFIFIPSLKKHYFVFMSTDMWFIYAIGSIFMLASDSEYFYIPTVKKCYVRHIFNEIGHGLVFSSLICRLAMNFPKINIVSEWIKKNKYIFILLLNLLHIISSIIIPLINTFNIRDVNFDKDDDNFKLCDYENIVGKVITYTQYDYNLILYLVTCFLIFIEWNISVTYNDLRHFTVVMITDGINETVLIVLNNLDIHNYLIFNLIHIIISALFILMNHIYIFIVRVIIIHINETHVNEEKMMSGLIQNIRYSGSYSFSKDKDKDKVSVMSESSASKKSSRVSRTYKSNLLNYHYTSSHIV